MKRNNLMMMMAMAGASLPVMAQNQTDSLKADRFQKQTIDVGANINFDREQSTAAVSVITSDEISHRSARNIGNAILGQGTGLISLQKSGNYAAYNPTFYVRGLQSLSGSSPLVLIDGIERNINYISSDEVESVSVLKDAAAVALYGYKGANGAILITTKRGKFNTKNSVKLSLDHSINFLANKPKFVDAQTYAKAMNEAYANDGKDPRYSQEEVDAFGSGKYPYLYPNVDWMGETFRNHSVTNKLDAEFQGGGQKFKYYTLLDLQYDNGFVKHANENEGYSTNNKYVKGNLRMNLDAQLTQSTTMKLNLLGVLAEANRPGKSANLWDMIYTLPAAAFPIRTENGLWGGNATWAGTKNPVAQSQAAAYDKNHERGIFTDLILRQDLSSVLPGLSAQARFAYDNTSNIYEDHSRTYEYGMQTVNGWLDGEPELGNFYKGGSTSEMGTGSSTNSFYRRTHFDVSADYQQRFGQHSLYAMLRWDYETEDENAINSTLNRQNFSLYTHYGFQDRYFLDLSMVESASNRLAPGSKWNFSPTVSAAWVISKENWMQNVSWVNFLKARASFGIINLDLIPGSGWNYYQQQYSLSGGTYPFTDSWTSTSGGRTDLAQMATENLGHEEAYKYNFGIDATLFGGLDISWDAYYQRRKGIWVSTAGKYTDLIGIDAPYEPDGITENWGTELGLDYNKKIGDVSFNIGGNISYNTSKVVNKNEAPVLYENLRGTGTKIGQLWGYKAIGLFKDQADIDNSTPQKLGSTPRPGDVKYEDINHDGVIDSNDKTTIGYSTTCPELYYSIHLGAEWKGLGFYALFQGTGRYSAVLNTKSMYKPLVGNTTISQYYYDNRWTPETAATAKFPALSSASNANNYQTSTLFLVDRSFFKLRNIEVYYNFPKSWFANTSLSAVKVYVKGNDLFSLDHMAVSDPESYGASHPLTRSVMAGVAVTF